MPNTISGILDILQRLDHASSLNAIDNELRACISRFGFTSYLIAELSAEHAGNWQDRILANGWPPEWRTRYLGRDFFRHDPLFERCRRTSEPFLWHEIDQESMSLPARAVLAEASKCGLRDGLCIPFHLPLSQPACVIFAGQSLHLTPHAILVLYVIAHHAFYSSLRLAGENRRAITLLLSQREREVLQWSAWGKTAWEISRILGISLHTINTHLRNIRAKYKTANTAHAVVEGIRRNEIHP